MKIYVYTVSKKLVGQIDYHTEQQISNCDA